MNNFIHDNLPKSISIKLYPVEYAKLYTYLARNFTHVLNIQLNSRVNEIILHDFFCRKLHIIKANAKSHSSKARTIALKTIEARALYDELKIHSHADVLIGQVFGHLDRALINAGMNNTINL